MMPTRDFSGLTSCAWALASAAAIVPIVSLERCTAVLRLEQFEVNSARFRALGANTVADRNLGFVRHQIFQFGFGLFVFGMGIPGARENSRELGPGIGRTHIDDANGRNALLWRFDAEQARGLAALHASPEFALSGDDKVLIERIGVSFDLNPFAAAGDHGEHRI